jgi:hypothetical protein
VLADPRGGEEAPISAEDDVFDDPDPETAETEEPATDGDGGVTVDLRGAPIGGGSDRVSSTLPCAEVNWSGPPGLLEGIEMGITEIAFEPAGVYVLSGQPCPGTPCLPRWLGSGTCTVPVTWTGEPSEVDGELFFTATRVTCAPELRDDCLAFERDLAETDRGVSLLPPTRHGRVPPIPGRTVAPPTPPTPAGDPTAAGTRARTTTAPPATVPPASVPTLSTGRAGEHRRAGAGRGAPRTLVRPRHHLRRAGDLPQRPALLLRVRELAGAVPGVRHRRRHPQARDPGLRDAQPPGLLVPLLVVALGGVLALLFHLAVRDRDLPQVRVLRGELSRSLDQFVDLSESAPLP